MVRPLPLGVPPDAEGPRVRLGLLWIAVVVAAAATSQLLLALVLGAAAAAAADEVAGAGQPDRPWPQRLPIGLATLALPLAAVAGSDTLAAAAAFVTVVVLVDRLAVPGVAGAVPDLAITLLASLALGLTAAMPVLVAGPGNAAAVVLLVLVGAYDTGAFLVGTGAATRWEGPAAGMAAAAVCGFAAWVAALPPLEGRGTAAVAMVVVVLAPLGPPVASVLLGHEGRGAGFVRRLDSLLVSGPVAAYAVAGSLAT